MNFAEMSLVVIAVYLPILLLGGYMLFETIRAVTNWFRNFELTTSADLDLPKSPIKPLVHR